MKRTALLCVLASSLVAPSMAMFPSSTFDSDAQGWRTASGGDYTSPIPGSEGGICGWDTRGNPGGALSIGDVHYQTYVAAPAGYLGDHRDMLGKSLYYDILIRYTDNVDYAPVGLVGGGLSLVYDAPHPGLGFYDRREVYFDASQWKVGSTTGPYATPAQLEAALANVEGLYFGTEWHTGTDDTSIDNVVPGNHSAAVLRISVTLEDFVGNVASKTVMVELYDWTTGSLVQTKSQFLNSSGQIYVSVENLERYDVRVKANGHLARLAPYVPIYGDTDLAVSLINGDVDGDNAVTVFDYNALSDAFDSVEGDPSWNRDADLDGDLSVTVFDYNILSANFDLAGD